MAAKYRKRLLVDDKRYLGNLLFLTLHDGKAVLKITFKNKIARMRVWERSFKALREFLFPTPQLDKKIEKGESFDISYNFGSRKLEIKQEIAGGEISRMFYDVTHPIDRHLFTIHLGHKHLLSEVIPAEDDIVLSTADYGEQIAIVFSLTGVEGKGFMDPNLPSSARVGRTIKIDLPNGEALFIGVAPDDHSLGDGDFLLTAPHPETKRSS
jgi:hypothetical protein